MGIESLAKSSREGVESLKEGRGPTLILYSVLQYAFDHFNVALFNGELPACLLTLRSSSRSHGYHHPDRFISPQGTLIDELGIHPGFFTVEPIEAVMSTLVHEMVHHWQHHFGTCSPSNPHNREWGEKMMAIGLQPSSTGLPGGRQTGRTMSDYIIPYGPFIRSCQALVSTGFALPWLDRQAPTTVEKVEMRMEALKLAGVEVQLSPAPVSVIPPMPEANAQVIWEPGPPKEKTRFKYACPKCSVSAWAGRDVALACGHCAEPLVCEEG